jgi:hypothetical protein
MIPSRSPEPKPSIDHHSPRTKVPHRHVEPTPPPTPVPVVQPDEKNKSCPRCGSPLIKRTAKKGTVSVRGSAPLCAPIDGVA